MDIRLKKIIDLVRAQLGLEFVQPEDRFMEELGAESVDILNIIASLEDQFLIELDEAEIAKVTSVLDLYHLLINSMPSETE